MNKNDHAYASAAVDEAEVDTNEAQGDSDDSVREAQEELQRTGAEFHESLGTARRDLDSIWPN